VSRPVAEGTAATLDLSYRQGDRNTALVFEGYLEIARAGIYTFYLDSDDGSQLYAGEPATNYSVAARKSDSRPRVKKLDEVIGHPAHQEWTEFEGVVTFASQSSTGLELELTGKRERFQVSILEPSAGTAASLLHHVVHGFGICETVQPPESRKGIWIVVPGKEQ